MLEERGGFGAGPQRRKRREVRREREREEPAWADDGRIGTKMRGSFGGRGCRREASRSGSVSGGERRTEKK